MVRPVGVSDQLAARIVALSPAQRALFELRYRRRAAAASRSPDSASPLVPLQSGGSRPPLFCVHPVGGTVYCYLELARQLGADQPFYGVQAVGLDGEEPAVDRLDELADRYAAAVEQAHGSGPCLLAGWSLGGIVAVEMARRLRSCGRRVPLLALLDPPPPQPAGTVPRYPDLLQGFVADMASLMGRQPPAVRDQLAALPAERWVDHVTSRLREAGMLVTELDATQVRHRIEVFLADVRALSRHELRPYDGRVTLLSTAAGAAEHWRGHAGQVDERPVPGDHYSFLRPPHVAATSVVLRSCIEAAIGTG